jgi:hypothetical protein
MHVSRAAGAAQRRSGERGGTRLKFLIVVIIIAAVAYAGYQFIPIAFQASQFKDYMQQNVDKAAAMNQNADWVVIQLKAGASQYDVPPDAEIKAAQRNGRMEATVRFTRPVSLIFYTYPYNFDYTARSSELFAPKSNP